MAVKSGYVTIIGRPNAGKSTLMNALMGEKLSIVTSKPQTTRKRVLGILSDDDFQIIFLDTPGLLNPNYLMQERLLGYINQSINDADLLIFLVDMDSDKRFSQSLRNESYLSIARSVKKPKLLILNKIDLSNQNEVEKAFGEAERLNVFDKIIPISAINIKNPSEIISLIKSYLPEHPKYFPDDQISDENERFFVSEIIREKIFEYYRDEIPFSVEVIIDDFKEREGRKDFISASIIVERESQKPIIIGNKGSSIKIIGSKSREEIERFLGRPVYLELHVKVKPKWRRDEKLLRSFGYIDWNEK
ncbi:MAG: GTPase Era [Melioribacteraceae bacterium]|nr:GTPase Era [Melioribacteraceae bacterium]